MTFAAPPDELLDGRWRVGEVIGRGAAADVHAATEEATGRRVAIKVLRSVDGDDEETCRRFDREIAALESLDHPGIIGVLGHGACPDGRRFIVMERAEGGTLHESLASGALGPATAASLGAELARALDHAHGRGVVHRDIKPGNVLLDGNGRAQVADFGIARVVGADTLTATGWALGTPAYLAPEQVRGEAVGPPADIYALGLLVLEAATGERAYPGDGLPAALARLERPPAIPDAVPLALAATLRAMTSASPDDRPTAVEAATRLEAVSDAGGTVAIPIAGVETTAVPIVAAAGAAGAAAAAADGSLASPAVPPPAPRPPSELGHSGAARGLAPVAALAGAAMGRARDNPKTRQVLFAAACFLVGFLAVLGLRAAIADDGGGEPGSPEPVATVVTTTTLPPTTTTLPPTTAPPEDDERDRDRDRPENGNGNGNGNGRGDDDDD